MPNSPFFLPPELPPPLPFVSPSLYVSTDSPRKIWSPGRSTDDVTFSAAAGVPFDEPRSTTITARAPASTRAWTARPPRARGRRRRGASGRSSCCGRRSCTSGSSPRSRRRAACRRPRSRRAPSTAAIGRRAGAAGRSAPSRLNTVDGVRHLRLHPPFRCVTHVPELVHTAAPACAAQRCLPGCTMRRRRSVRRRGAIRGARECARFLPDVPVAAEQPPLPAARARRRRAAVRDGVTASCKPYAGKSRRRPDAVAPYSPRRAATPPPSHRRVADGRRRAPAPQDALLLMRS